MMGLRTVKKQGGFTALELLVVLIVTVAALGLGSQYLMSYADTQVNQAAADHNKTVADAATKYTKDNYAAILATATSSSPAVITVPMLKSTGYLTSSVTDQNPYGQTYEIRALQPVANKLETLIVTLGGETIPEMDLRRIAQVSGARGGYISSTNTAVATGSYGGWQMPLANYGTSPGAGHLATALFFDDGALVSDYLYRNAVAGHPEFNRMNTAIDMNGNNINNAGTVNATTLNATGDTNTGGWFRSQGDTGWYSQKWGGGWYMSDSNWIRSVNDKNVYTAGQMQAGTMRSNGRLSTGEYLQVDGVAVENQPCGARTVGLDANGLTLSCQSGVWTKQFALSTESRDYYASEFTSTVTISGLHYTRTWSFSISKPSKTFIHIHFKPKISYSGSTITFNSFIYVNGNMCSFKSAQFSGVSGVHDTMCSFVATAGTIYTIILQYNNNPSTTGYWYDDGTPLVTYISI